MARPQKSFNSRLYVDPYGNHIEGSALDLRTKALTDMQQEREHDRNDVRERRIAMGQYPFSPSDYGVLPNPNWDAYFGMIKGRQRAAEAQGRQYDFDRPSWGNDGDMLKFDRRTGETSQWSNKPPTVNPLELSAPGAFRDVYNEHIMGPAFSALLKRRK